LTGSRWLSDPSHLEDALKIEKRMWDELETNPFDTNEKRVVAKMIKEIARGIDD
jgi:hypothetical protein